MDEKAKVYMELAADQLVPYQGAIEFIRDLAGHGVSLALVTGSLRAEAEVTLEAFGLSDLFKVIIAAEDILQSKPSPEGYLKRREVIGL